MTFDSEFFLQTKGTGMGTILPQPMQTIAMAYVGNKTVTKSKAFRIFNEQLETVLI